MVNLKLVLTFQSVNHTMMVEKSLLSKGFEIKTIPTPREISNSCGLSIMTSYDNLEALKKLMEEGEKILHIFLFETSENKKKAEMIV